MVRSILLLVSIEDRGSNSFLTLEKKLFPVVVAVGAAVAPLIVIRRLSELELISDVKSSNGSLVGNDLMLASDVFLCSNRLKNNAQTIYHNQFISKTNRLTYYNVRPQHLIDLAEPF